MFLHGFFYAIIFYNLLIYNKFYFYLSKRVQKGF